MSFVRYCKLILGILGWLATPVKKDSIKLLKTLMFPCMQKICLLAENLDVYQHAKNQLHHLLISWDIGKILHSCYFEYFRHAQLHPSDMNDSTNFMKTLKFISAKINSISYFFLKILQRFWKLIISSTLGKTSHIHQYW